MGNSPTGKWLAIASPRAVAKCHEVVVNRYGGISYLFLQSRQGWSHRVAAQKDALNLIGKKCPDSRLCATKEAMGNPSLGRIPGHE